MIEYAPASTNRKDHTILQGTLKAEVLLGPSIRHVRAGTPLIYVPDAGWLPALAGWGELVAGEAGYGADRIVAYRQAVVKVHAQKLPTGRLGLEDIDDTGFVVFKSDANGPFIRLAASLVLMDMTYTASIMGVVRYYKSREVPSADSVSA